MGQVDEASTCQIDDEEVVTEEVRAENGTRDIGDVKLMFEEPLPEMKCDSPLAPRTYEGAVGGYKVFGTMMRLAVEEGGREG